MNKPVFIALDFPNLKTAFDFLNKFPSHEKPAVKVGMELFYAEGPKIIQQLREKGYKVFLDLKLYDIPHTVAAAVRSLTALDVQYLTIHGLGGLKMMEAAVDAAEGKIKLLAVTQLTSISENEMRGTQLTSATIEQSVKHLTQLALLAGVDGTISSPLEANIIKQITPDDFLKITPGIRLFNDQNGDQIRITTPKKAKEFGASGLVVGRSITQVADPLAVYRKILEEFE
ncbi:orotidine 5'-phosphate decarboxylase [Oenococcus oeni S12]|uniref:orotidine-5'-phosphate decarboxylase n=1 Tax=Oenococcus oeni TaxID=1247 RepID=UPI0005103DC0|nr:orotidine-5'-phosphate decarboxylase [Oenococcus oeni]KGH88383.1 orotidine 5'-phosphate decarboxylase [Oenococcus oeni S12]